MSKIKNLINKIDLNILLQKIYITIPFLFVSTILFRKILPSTGTSILFAACFFSFIFVLTLFINNQYIKNTLTNNISPWVYSLGVSITLSIVNYLIHNIHTKLSNFPERIVGLTVSLGIDASTRSNYYVGIVVVSIILFIGCVYSISKLDHLLNKNISTNYRNFELSTLNMLSICACLIQIINNLYFSSILNSLYIFIILLILINITSIVFGTLLIQHNNCLVKYLRDIDIFIFSFLFPIIIFFVRWILVNGSFVFTQQYLLVYTIFWAIYWIIIYILTKTLEKIKRAKYFSKSFLFATIPLCFIPISAIISNEFQYTLSRHFSISIYAISNSIVIFLILLSTLLFILCLLKKSDVKINFSEYIYFPLVVITLAAINSHINTIEIGGVDMFHHGENLITTQQLFLFGRIPFINLYPTHGMSYAIGQIIYTLLNGYKIFEPWLGEWITKAFEMSLLYFLIRKIINAPTSLFIIIFLPIMGVFGGARFTYGHNLTLITTYYFTSFIAAITLAILQKKFNFRNLFIYWVACFALTAWRVDFGLASFAGGLFIILTRVIYSSNKVDDLKQILSSLIFTTSIAIVLATVLCFISKVSIIDIIHQIISFVVVQAPSQSLDLLSTKSTPFILQYFIGPTIGIFYVVYYLIQIIKNKAQNFKEHQWILLFLAIFSLIMSVRSVQRQTLDIMGYNFYLFAFLFICLPYYLNAVKDGVNTICFGLLFILYYFIFPNNTLVIKDGQQISFKNWVRGENRITVKDIQYREISEFINNNLKQNQTFIDLSSSPMLYLTTNRKFINYFIPPTYWTSESIQKYMLSLVKNSHDKGELPIIIYKQPIVEANALDGVPNEIRSYRIYEYLYANYKPAGVFKNYEIWIDNNYQLPHPEGLVSTNGKYIQTFSLGKLAYIWGTYDTFKASKNTILLSNLIDKSVNISKNIYLTIPNFDKIDKLKGNYLHLVIKSDKDGILNITYGIKSQSSFTLSIIGSNKPEDYMIRMSTQYNWSKEDIQTIQLSSKSKMLLINADLRRGD